LTHTLQINFINTHNIQLILMWWNWCVVVYNL
jgi:hypothetical protein